MPCCIARQEGELHFEHMGGRRTYHNVSILHVQADKQTMTSAICHKILITLSEDVITFDNTYLGAELGA